MHRSKVLRFRETIEALKGDIFHEKCPFNATCTSIVVHFPSGCAGLVDMAIGHGDSQVCPREGRVTLDNATVTFDITEDIDYEEIIWYNISNRDESHSHTPVVLLTLVERP